MPKKLQSFDFASNSSGTRYDWKMLLDGSIYELVKGTDFNCEVSTFASLARKQAALKNLSLRTSSNKAEGKFTMQAVAKAGDAAKAPKSDAPKADTKAAAKSTTPAVAPKDGVPKRVTRTKSTASAAS